MIRLAMNLNHNLEECPIVHDDVFLVKDESLIAFFINCLSLTSTYNKNDSSKVSSLTSLVSMYSKTDFAYSIGKMFCCT